MKKIKQVIVSNCYWIRLNNTICNKRILYRKCNMSDFDVVFRFYFCYFFSSPTLSKTHRMRIRDPSFCLLFLAFLSIFVLPIKRSINIFENDAACLFCLSVIRVVWTVVCMWHDKKFETHINNATKWCAYSNSFRTANFRCHLDSSYTFSIAKIVDVAVYMWL